MTPQAQRIAIAEACGWNRRSDLDYICLDLNTHSDVKRSIWERGGFAQCEEDLPNYLTDLNAMHEAENVLTPDQRIDYVILLGRVVSPSKSGDHNFDMVHATAAQRAEAFLRTLGKWEEGE